MTRSDSILNCSTLPPDGGFALVPDIDVRFGAAETQLDLLGRGSADQTNRRALSDLACAQQVRTSGTRWWQTLHQTCLVCRLVR